MGWSITYTVMGFPLRFTNPDAHEEHGIVLTPEFDLDAPNAIDALKLAQQAYPHIQSNTLLYEIVHYFERKGTILYGEDNLRKIIDELRGQSMIDVDETELKIAEWALDPHHQNLKRAELGAKTKAIKTNKPGYVYLVQEVNGPHYKIGKAKHPKARQETFNVKLPYKVEFLCVIQSDDMGKLELELHQRFAGKRVDGEWFLLDAADVDYIKALA